VKHCKSCENCNLDLVSLYFYDVDLYQCVLDGHKIDDPFWDKCEHYRKFTEKPMTMSSWMFRLVQLVKKNLK